MTLTLSLEDSPFLLEEHGPIFIVGCPRSGTTFLEDCIAAARQVEAFTGVLVSPRLLHLIGDRASRREDVESLLLVMRDSFWQAFWRRVFFFSERVGEVASRKSRCRICSGARILMAFRSVTRSPFCASQSTRLRSISRRPSSSISFATAGTVPTLWSGLTQPLFRMKC